MRLYLVYQTLNIIFCVVDELETAKRANWVLDKLNIICSCKQAQRREAKELRLVSSWPMNFLGQKLSVSLLCQLRGCSTNIDSIHSDLLQKPQFFFFANWAMMAWSFKLKITFHNLSSRVNVHNQRYWHPYYISSSTKAYVGLEFFMSKVLTWSPFFSRDQTHSRATQSCK